MSAPTVETALSAWKIAYINAQNAQEAPRLTSMFLKRLTVQQMGRWDMLEVKRGIERQGLTKNGLAVVLRRRVRPAYGNNAMNLDLCSDVESSLGYVNRTYMLDQQVAATAIIDKEKFRCLNQSDIDSTNAVLADFYNELHERLGNSLESMLYSKDGSGNYKYIGSLPALSSPGVPRPYAEIPLLNADGKTINPAGLLAFQQDMNAVGASSNYFALGNTRAMAYAMAQNIQVPNLNGYNLNVTNDILSASKIMNSFLIANAFTDISNPFVVIEDGALAFASAPLYPLGQVIEGDGQRMWSQEHPNLPGVYINITETIEKVCDANTLPKIKWVGTVIFALIGKMTCDYEGNFFSEANNGVYRYDIKCADEGMCELPNRSVLLPNFVMPYGKDCVPEQVCDPTCRLDGLQVGYKEINGVNYAVFNAVFTAGAGGGLPEEFEWSINGSADPDEKDSIFLIAVDDLNDGDVVSVSAIGSLDCDAEFSFEPFVLPDAFRGVLTVINTDGFVVLTNGVTINAGNITQDDTQNINLDLSVIGPDVIVSNITYTGVLDIAVPATLPQTISEGGGNLSVNAQYDSTVLGAKTGSLLIQSNAAGDEFFIVNFTWNVIP